ncbi:MAG: PIG-L family deacetylase [Candidatus Latescibacteria bacterium]|nr:PIG-L family deacetylase [Candidatus Latescibacterota bacterium]
MIERMEKKAIPFGEVTVERCVPGEPHTGKVLAAIQAHADDIPIYCAGAVAKLIDEGYTAYLIQTTNDEKCGPTMSFGETILQNEREVEELTNVLGFKKVFFMGYRNHLMDEASSIELRCRLMFLIRALKIDTVFTFNPWGHGEENPDHWVTGQAVEAACWMAGNPKDYPEHLTAGVMPHSVREKYYWVVRPGQPYNRVVDISPYIDRRIEALRVNKAQGPAGSHGSMLRARLTQQGLRLPALGDDDETADREYIRLFCSTAAGELGQECGVEYAEPFFYVPPGGSVYGFAEGVEIERYIAEHAVPIT